MWTLYAEQHWTKAVDLKSAVELGALEFNADHEAIYGMERYYTVQQCEKLRDKYKNGRKTVVIRIQYKEESKAVEQNDEDSETTEEE
ncbi:hypothetical protein FQA39_LY02574 [Lamprigera yunnana]|nr:hypothetical protein FQA39_LY02574 [Lamprigera yunnana]